MSKHSKQRTLTALTALMLGVALSPGLSLAQGRFPRGRSFPGPNGNQGLNSTAGANAARGLTSSAAVANTSGAQMPVVMGVITGGNSTTGQIMVQTQNGSGIVQVTNSTQIMAQTTTSSSNLQVNDVVQCPVNTSTASTSAASSSTTSGSSGTTSTTVSPSNRSSAASAALNRAAVSRQAASLQRPGFMTRGSVLNSTGSGVAARPAVGAQFTSVTGRVTSTSPLTISNGVGSASLSVPSNTPVTKFTPLTFSNLRIGDRVMIAGQVGNSGTFTAVRIAVNRN